MLFKIVTSLVPAHPVTLSLALTVYTPEARPFTELVWAKRLAGKVFCPVNHSKENPVVTPPTSAVADPFGNVMSQEVWLAVAVAVTTGGSVCMSVTVTGSELHWVEILVATTV
jgi:hypothetical protein